MQWESVTSMVIGWRSQCSSGNFLLRVTPFSWHWAKFSWRKV